MIKFEWKPITEIPTEHWDKNTAISPRYLVKCDGNTYDGLPVIGYTHYNFATNEWMDCWCCTNPVICSTEEVKTLYKVIAWTDVKL